MLEDDSDDRYLTTEVLADLPFDLQIHFFSNSHDLLKAITQEKPDLILVDFNSTPENGIQVLKRLKSNAAFRPIPVVILSDSNLPKYRDEAYAEGACTFATKPSSLEETKKKINTFFSYWTGVAEL